MEQCPEPIPFDLESHCGLRATMGGHDFQTRVLVVDDEPIILETTSAVLRDEGLAVRTAEDGFAALITLRQTLPDIIISDLRMPNMSGFEFLSVSLWENGSRMRPRDIGWNDNRARNGKPSALGDLPNTRP